MSSATSGPVKVAVLGLGEAGSRFAAALASLGDEVSGYDPSEVPTPAGVARHDLPSTVVAGCHLVLAMTPGSDAVSALEGTVDALEEGSLYADLSTASPPVKATLAGMAAPRQILFADVALMSAVPRLELATPSLVSGDGAKHYAELINARGGAADVVGDRAGEAAARKLLRSVVMKGLAALLIESMAAADAYGEREWLWGHLVSQLTSIDIALLERLLYETDPHAHRRLDEMIAAEEMLASLGVPADMTRATIARLRRLTGQAEPGVSIGR